MPDVKISFDEIAKTTKSTFVAYFKGQLIISLILSVLFSVGYLLAGIKFAIPAGILTGILSFIPVIGEIIGFAIALVIAVIQFHAISPILQLILTYALISLLENFLITPKIMGAALGINPLLSMAMLIVGGLFFGPIGLIVAIPLACVLYKLCRKQLI
jgi:predicted PurR-regulated permease PerM